jgi:hypothetical protein
MLLTTLVEAELLADLAVVRMWFWRIPPAALQITMKPAGIWTDRLNLVVPAGTNRFNLNKTQK